MPSCVLRVSGSTVKVHRFLRESSLELCKVYQRGEPRFRFSLPAKLNETSGFNVSMSGSHGGSIRKMASEALAFMRQHREELLRLKTMRFRSMCLDFGLYDLSTEDRPWPSYRLPAKLIEAAGEFGFDVVLSFYGPP